VHPAGNAIDASAAAGSVADETPQPSWRSRLLRAGGLLLAAAGLFILYFRQSQVASFNSDGAALVLQAQDILHGNLLLRGWWTADVSFYTTELPEYVLVSLVRGLRPDVVHICGALTYTLAVLLAALLARGRAKGLAGVVRALLAVGIMLAPSIAGGTPTLLENPDHFGTAVPILVILLVLDRARERWYVPVVVCGLLAWAQVADELALVAVAVPVGAVAVVRLVVLAIRLRPLREFWYDTALGMAAAVSIPLAAGTEKAIRALGGFDLLPLPRQLLVTRSQLPGHIRALGETLLLLFGANGQGNHGLALLAPFHLIGLALAGLALLAAIIWYVTRVDRVTQVVAAAAVATMAAAILTIEVSSCCCRSARCWPAGCCQGCCRIGSAPPAGRCCQPERHGSRSAWPHYATRRPGRRSPPRTCPWRGGSLRMGTPKALPPTGRPAAPRWTAAARRWSPRSPVRARPFMPGRLMPRGTTPARTGRTLSSPWRTRTGRWAGSR
jgi:hypothetical protein